MKKFALALATAFMALAPTTATAATPLAEHGPFTVAALDDMQTCAMGANNGTVGFYLSYNASTDILAFSGTNVSTKVVSGETYKVNVNLDGKTFTWSGKGIVLKSGSGVVLEAGNSVDAAKALYDANVITLTFTASGNKLMSVNSDANFEAALKDTVTCAFMLQEMAAGSSQSKATTTKKTTKPYIS